MTGEYLREAMAAFDKAEKAGNIEDARFFADKIDRLRGVSRQPPEQPGVVERLVHGAREPFLGTLQYVSNKFPALGDKIDEMDRWAANTKIGKAIGLAAPEGGYRKAVPAWQQNYNQRLKDSGFKDTDWARMVGNIASPINLAIGAGVGAAAKGVGGAVAGALRSKAPVIASKALKSLGVVGAGAGAGAAGALTSPVSEGDFDEGKAKQLKSGALWGAGFSAAGPVIGRMLNPNTDRNIKLLLKEGVTPTPGQIMGGIPKVLEDKAASLPLVGDLINSARSKSIDEFNRAAYSRVLKQIGKRLDDKEVGYDGIRKIRLAIADEYNDVLPKMQFKPDQGFYSALKKTSGDISKLPEDKQRAFNDVVDNLMNKVASPDGVIDGNSYKQAISELKRISSDYLRDASVDNRSLGKALKNIADEAHESLKRTNPADLVNKLNKADSAFALRKRISAAAASTGAKEGVFTPAQLKSQVRAQDKSFGRTAYSEGDALLQDLTDAGTSVLSPVYPDSGTAGRGMFASALLGGGVGGGLAAGSPASAAALLGGGAAASLPYIDGGRQVAAALLARRPDFVRKISVAPNAAARYLTPGIASSSVNSEERARNDRQ